MKEVVMTLGFRSENALKYMKIESGHHKLWRILEITYIALTRELLFPFMKQAIEAGEAPTLLGFWSYIDKVKNENYLYCLEMAFTYLHALMLLRKGSRANDSEAISGAISKLKLLFFGTNHPLYREILYNDLRIRYLAPPEILRQINANITATRTSKKGHYQGGDALLEEVNKEAKEWVIGVPTAKQLLRSFRTMEKLTLVSFFVLIIDLYSFDNIFKSNKTLRIRYIKNS